MKRGRTSKSEIDFVLGNASTLSVERMAKKLNRTVGFVQKIVDGNTKDESDIVGMAVKVNPKEKKNKLFGTREGISIMSKETSSLTDGATSTPSKKVSEHIHTMHKE